MDDQTQTIFGLGIGIVLTSIVAFIIISNLRKKISNLNFEKDSALLEVSKLKEQIVQYGPLENLSDSIKTFEEKVKELKLQLDGQKSTFDATSEEISKMKKEIELFQDTLELGTYGVYQPQFNFEVSSQYAEKLELIFQKQRLLIKQGAGAKCDLNWTVGGSEAQGKKMTKQYEKLMIFAFNGECEAIISKVKWNNVEKLKERIVKIYENVNTLGSTHQVYITKAFLESKLEELALTYEYELKKYEEKEEQKRLKEQMKEEERALRELERAKKSAEQDEIAFEREIEKTKQQLESGLIENKNELLEKIAQLEAELLLAQERKERAISMAQQTKVGHIYVVSNIGAFGENVYKIGMTRRLDPKERVKELGDASVPFHFDVHAIIYSENAPQLEYEIHKQFDKQRLNKINYRKEFFKITLEELEKFILTKTNAEIEFTKLSEAAEYRQTLALIEKLTITNNTIVLN